MMVRKRSATEVRELAQGKWSALPLAAIEQIYKTAFFYQTVIFFFHITMFLFSSHCLLSQLFQHKNVRPHGQWLIILFYYYMENSDFNVLINVFNIIKTSRLIGLFRLWPKNLAFKIMYLMITGDPADRYFTSLKNVNIKYMQFFHINVFCR